MAGHCLGLAIMKAQSAASTLFSRQKKTNAVPVSRNYSFPAYLGASEAFLSLGDFEKARYYARRLHDLSIGAPEKTYLALSHWLFAKIAVTEDAFDEASAQIASALVITKSSEIPLATWRIYDIAEKFHLLRGEMTKASVFHYKRRGAIRKLLDSLPASDPLHEKLYTLTRVWVPAVVHGAMEIRPPQPDPDAQLVDAA